MDIKDAATLVKILDQGKKIGDNDLIELDEKCRNIPGFMKLVANEVRFASRDSVRIVIDRALKKYGKGIRKAIN